MRGVPLPRAIELFGDLDAHAASGAGDGVFGGFDRDSVQIGHLLFGQCAQLLAANRADCGAIWGCPNRARPWLPCGASRMREGS